MRILPNSAGRRNRAMSAISTSSSRCNGCATISWRSAAIRGGQSGGGAKIVTLMAMAKGRPLFHAAATMSGQHVTAAGPNHATIRSRALMENAGASDFAGLKALPVGRLVEAMAMTDPIEDKGEISFTSTLDHHVLTRHPFYPDAPREAAHIPLIVGNTHDETGLWIGETLRRGDTTWENLPERLVREMTKDVAPDHVIRRYRELYPDRTPGQILLAASTAARSWPGHLIQAEERAKIGAPTWMYQLDFPSPKAGGVLDAFHSLDIGLVFDNTRKPSARTGDGVEARRLAGRMADAFIALARTGDPNCASVPAWRHYDLARRSTMIFDRAVRMEDDPRREERLLFAVAPYIKPGDNFSLTIPWKRERRAVRVAPHAQAEPRAGAGLEPDCERGTGDVDRSAVDRHGVYPVLGIGAALHHDHTRVRGAQVHQRHLRRRVAERMDQRRDVFRHAGALSVRVEVAEPAVERDAAL
jgi:hypothetical protein